MRQFGLHKEKEGIIEDEVEVVRGKRRGDPRRVKGEMRQE